MTDTALSPRDRAPLAPQAARALSIVSIAKAYDARPVLQDVSLEVARGEVVGLLGPTARARPPASIR